MKWIIKVSASLFFIFLLAGCIGEDYDYSPPAASLLSYPDLMEEELEAANIDWNSDEEYTKTTDNIYSFAEEQKPMQFYSEQQIDVLFEHQDFEIKELSVYVSQNGKETELPVDEQTFHLPEDEGEYVIIADLLTNQGSVEYVGNLIVEERDTNPYPPAVSLENDADEKELELMKADWQLSDGAYTKETDDMSSFISEQKTLQYASRQQLNVLFEHEDYEIKELKVYVSQNDEKTELPVDNQTFKLPEDEGEYIIGLELLTDQGSAEYAGRLVIE
ncbi:hypothetical protein [Oceanobacillus sojae]|uniref:hypothetical protein n=1 Tax=Oceanobacillus sojae TaxID=582851 RepID=UPI0021A8BBBE|nr:hypothetical protein [Oceanobacillus sojae]MCT1902949.1 hypothetical protein [Oceanobacillus sojae]